MKLNHPVFFLSVVALASQSGIADTGLLNQQLESLLKLNTGSPSSEACAASRITPDTLPGLLTNPHIFLTVEFDAKGCHAAGYTPRLASTMEGNGFANVWVVGSKRILSKSYANAVLPASENLWIFEAVEICDAPNGYGERLCRSIKQPLATKKISLQNPTGDTQTQVLVKNCLTVTLTKETQALNDQYNFLKLACNGERDRILPDFDKAYSNFQKSLASIQEKHVVIRQDARLVTKYRDQLVDQIQLMETAKTQIQGNQKNLEQLGPKVMTPNFQLMNKVKMEEATDWCGHSISCSIKVEKEHGRMNSLCSSKLKDLSLVYLEKAIDSEEKIKKAKREVKALLP